MKASLLIKNAGQVVTALNASARPKIKEDLGKIAVICDGAVAVAGERILSVGTTEEVERQNLCTSQTEIIDARGKIVLPGLVDAHTHLIFGGSREDELDLKLQGVPYLEILKQGGGILNTVRATRAASLEELVEIGSKYAGQMLAQGTTTAEAKSGYGLTVEDEIKMLQAIKAINERHSIDLVPTFLGAHAVPPEFKEDASRYVELVIEEMLPAVAEKGLAEYCDVFCEQGVFTREQSREILTAARGKGLKARIHADEIAAIGGSELAAHLGAVSADHLLVITEQGIGEMARKGIIANLLPATAFYLREQHYAPARRMIEAGVPVVLASDFNPGSCPNNNLQPVMTIAALYLKMTAAEIINAMTINAAHSLERAWEIGSLEAGKKADIVIFDAPSYQYLPYRFGTNLVEKVIKNGKLVIGGECH
ncbi:MAG: imidazolonepropionase [Peptococcaceae bacterium]